MSAVPAIAAVRVAGIRPAPPTVGADPWEDGLDVDLVTEPLVHEQPVNRVAPAADSHESGHDPARRAFIANAVTGTAPTSPIASIDVAAGRRPGGPQGNASVGTSFDARPASTLGDPPRGTFATPFARAMQTYGQA